MKTIHFKNIHYLCQGTPNSTHNYTEVWYPCKVSRTNCIKDSDSEHFGKCESDGIK